MKAQPMIAVQDVRLSAQWYESVLGLRAGHGGGDYEQLFSGDHMVLQLHRWNVHEHAHLGNPALPCGNGSVLWFQSTEVEQAYQRAENYDAIVLEALHINHQAKHREFWLQDIDGYVVVVAGCYGEVDT